MTILITGSAGFIGANLARRLLNTTTENLVLIDNLTTINKKTENLEVELKLKRLERLNLQRLDVCNKKIVYTDRVKFYHIDIANKSSLEDVFKSNNINTVIHLAAQAGVRYSAINPDVYIKSNITGFFNVLDLSRIYNVSKFIYASSSSVYGESTEKSFSETDELANQKSIYAVTKRSNELLAESYSSLFGISTIGLRFFSVYGEYGRPDMVVWKWTENILTQSPLILYGDGSMARSFTYIEDVVDCITLVLKKELIKNSSLIYNIGNENSICLSDVINHLETFCGKNAIITHAQPSSCDVQYTCANMQKFFVEYNYKPTTTITNGLQNFVNWFKNYFVLI